VRDAALRRVAKRRHLVVPSLVADVRVEEGEAPSETADEPPVEEVLLAAGEMAEQAEQAEMAEQTKPAEVGGRAEPAEGAEVPEGAEGPTPEPIASVSDRGEGRS
jgi:hypothetical protein